MKSQDLRLLFKKKTKAPTTKRIPAVLGNLWTSEVYAEGTSLIYCTLSNYQVVRAVNQRVPNQLGSRVFLVNTGGFWEVESVREVFNKNESEDILPYHAETHQWPSADALYLKPEQFLSGLAIPTSGFVVQFMGSPIKIGSEFSFVEAQEIDLSGETVSSGACWVKVESDIDGVISFNASTPVADLSLLDFSEIPITLSSKYCLFVVRMYLGQSGLSNKEGSSDFFDTRFITQNNLASAIEWVDILSKPSVFLPDLTITDPRYSRVYTSLAAPSASDDSSLGYKVGDRWIDTLALVVYEAFDVSIGAAVWIAGGGGGGSGGGSGDLNFRIPGTLSTGVDAYSFLVTQGMTIDFWYIFCEDPGTAGSTLYDVMLNGTTIFSVTGDRPTLVWNDSDGWSKSGTPDTINFVEGDILTIDIISVATGSEGLIGVGQVIASGGGGTGEVPLGLNIYMNRNFR